MSSFQYAPSAFSSFICFVCVALYAACHGYAFHLTLDIEEVCDGCDFGADEGEDSRDYLETQQALLFTIAAILSATSIFYAIHRCVESYCMLILRLIGNVIAMVVLLGYACGALDKDGTINTDAVRDHTFSTSSDWGSTVIFALAWIAISAFEINEFSFASSRIHVGALVKFMVFLFWTLLAVSFCVSGEKLLNDVDIEATDVESVYSKILLATAAMSFLAALLFAMFSTCDLAEFAKLHMIAGALTAILYVSANAYQSYHFREEMDKMREEAIDNMTALSCVRMMKQEAIDKRSCKKFIEEFFDRIMEIHNCRVAGDVFLGLAIMMSIGFDWYFLSGSQATVEANVSRHPGASAVKTIQLSF